jgi:hypothetical protein
MQMFFEPDIKHPSGFVPVALSLLALVLVVGHAVIFGVHQHAGGIAAIVFQVLMASQLPVVMFLIVTCLRRAPRPTLRILGLQAAAAAAAYIASLLLS